MQDCSSESLKDVKKQFHFSSDCTPVKENECNHRKRSADATNKEETEGSLNSPATVVSTSCHQAKEDLSSDFDVSMSSDLGHESGIHPLPLWHSRDNSLEDIKEELSGDVKSSDDVLSVSTSSPKNSSDGSRDLSLLRATHSPVQSVNVEVGMSFEEDPEFAVSDLSNCISPSNRSEKDITSGDTKHSQVIKPCGKQESSNNSHTVSHDGKKQRCTSSEYGDVFLDEVAVDSEVDVFDGCIEPVSSFPVNYRSVAKCHPRLRALSQLTHQMSPVGNPPSLLSAVPGIVTAEIATSSPLPPNFEESGEGLPSQKTLERFPKYSSGNSPNTFTRSSQSLSNISMASVSKVTDCSQSFSQSSEENHPKVKKSEDPNPPSKRILSSTLNSCQSRGIKRSIGSAISPTLPPQSPSSGLTGYFEVLGVHGQLQKKRNVRRSSCDKSAMHCSSIDSESPKSSQVGITKRYDEFYCILSYTYCFKLL